MPFACDDSDSDSDSDHVEVWEVLSEGSDANDDEVREVETQGPRSDDEVRVVEPQGSRSDGHNNTSITETMPRHSILDLTVDIPTSMLDQPRSVAVNYEPCLPRSTEREALRGLLNGCKDGNVDIELDDFEIYMNATKYPKRLRPLHFLRGSQNSHDTFFFDGVLACGRKKFYVQEVQFSIMQIGGYGPDNDTVRGSIWIKSKLNEHGKIYYRLKEPSEVYSRFFVPFLWVADMGKHFVDFCSHYDFTVRLSHFQRKFSRWLKAAYPHSQAVKNWRAQYGHGDYRSAVVAHRDHLWKEFFDLEGRRAADRLLVFSEIFYDKTDSKSVSTQPTIVTPYVYQCFSGLAVHSYMKPKLGNKAPAIFPQESERFRTGPGVLPVDSTRQQIYPGSVISILPDTATEWAPEAKTGSLWYALVHKITHARRSQERLFDVVWLYRPEHTLCRQQSYPWAKELFLSDHCTCDEGPEHIIAEQEVQGVYSVEWFGTQDTKADFFIRQTYLPESRRFVKLQSKHIFCRYSVSQICLTEFRDKIDSSTFQESCQETCQENFEGSKPFKAGDTVLAVYSDKDIYSQPFEVMELWTPGEGVAQVRLRKLLQRRKVDPQAGDSPPNELVYTEKFATVPQENIVSHCMVRAFRPNTEIPTPYNRDGTGNIFFMTHKQIPCRDQGGGGGGGGWSYVPIEDDRLTMRQGFDPTAACNKLRALDLFCGCGNLGRGLEDSGVVESRFANDIWDRATRTFAANSPAAVEPFLGSADDLLSQALDGCYSPSVPAPGQVDLISGGSPCQGFSLKTIDKEAIEQFKNRSMVASFASFVDLYRPKYGILENVLGLVDNDGRQKIPSREDIFGGLVCSLVGLGYQVSTALGNSWSYGAPQRRQRAFLVFARPDMRLPEEPYPSHGLPPTFNRRRIGNLSDGLPIAEAGVGPTAFPFVSTFDAIADLQRGSGFIGDGIADTCIAFPDHRISVGMTTDLRRRLKRSHSSHSTQVVEQHAKRLKLVNPESLFPTITTSCNVQDKFSGGMVHWLEPRPMSVQEVRRAQGIPDDEVLIGSPSEQWTMVGNAVTRQTALAFGLAFREAYLGSLTDDFHSHPATDRDSMPQMTTSRTTTTKLTTTTRTMTTTMTTTVELSSSPPVVRRPVSSSTSTESTQNHTVQTSVEEKRTVSAAVLQVVLDDLGEVESTSLGKPAKKEQSASDWQWV